MKRILKNTVAATVLFATVAGMANGPEGAFGKKSFEVEKNLIKVDLDPVFKRKGQKLLVNLLNLDQEKVAIKVFDSQGRLIFKEIIKNDIIIEKAFNFEQAYADDYTVVIVDNDKTFKEKVEVK